jgi:hypothetical protein
MPATPGEPSAAPLTLRSSGLPRHDDNGWTGSRLHADQGSKFDAD